jgi:hypothetical protein
VASAKNEIASYTSQRCSAETGSCYFAGSDMVVLGFIIIVIFSPRGAGY